MLTQTVWELGQKQQLQELGQQQVAEWGSAQGLQKLGEWRQGQGQGQRLVVQEEWRVVVMQEARVQVLRPLSEERRRQLVVGLRERQTEVGLGLRPEDLGFQTPWKRGW